MVVPGPKWIRGVHWAAGAVFTYGTIVHTVQLAEGGTSAYQGVPGWLAAFFTVLVVLDPVAAVAIIRQKRWGWTYGTAVLTLDASPQHVVTN